MNPRLGSSLLVVVALSLVPAPVRSDQLVLVPELEEPVGLRVDRRGGREALRDRADVADGLERFEAEVRARWREVRAIDLVELSRLQVEATRDFTLASDPGPLVGRGVGRDPETGRLTLELQGPRLPARFDIVHRYLFFYATWDPSSTTLGRITVTIRGWVLE